MRNHGCGAKQLVTNKWREAAGRQQTPCNTLFSNTTTRSSCRQLELLSLEHSVQHESHQYRRKYSSTEREDALRKVDVEEVEVQRRLHETRGDGNHVDPVLGLRNVSGIMLVSTANLDRRDYDRNMRATSQDKCRTGRRTRRRSHTPLRAGRGIRSIRPTSSPMTRAQCGLNETATTHTKRDTQRTCRSN